MLLGSVWVAVLGLRVEEKDLTIVHADDEIHIEERFLALAVAQPIASSLSAHICHSISRPLKQGKDINYLLQ